MYLDVQIAEVSKTKLTFNIMNIQNSYYLLCTYYLFFSTESHGVLHGFPNYVKEPERFRSWLYAVGGDILSLSNEHIYKNRRVCHSHFENKYCLRNNRISAIAVPTLNLLGM